MMKARTLTALALISTLLAMPGLALAAVGDSSEAKALQEAKSGKAAKIGPWLAALHDEYSKSKHAKKQKAFKSRLPAIRIKGEKVRVEGLADDPAGLSASLEAMGATEILMAGRLFSANVPISALDELGSAPSLRFAGPVAAKTREASQGAVVGQGDLAINAPAARLSGEVDGTGVRVGILSDSFECDEIVFEPGAPNPRSDEDKANEDVDPGILVLADGCPGGSDEGRGMANLVKDVAPGAKQAFHTAFNSRLDFALGILELGGIETGFSDPPPFVGPPFYTPTTGDDVSDVIVDDVIYFVEPMFSPGQVAQAANTVAVAGIPYFSSAGNNARNSYESEFDLTVRNGNNGRNLNSAANGPNATRRHDFDPGVGVDDTQTIAVFPDASGLGVTVFSFQWDEPHASSTAFANAANGDWLTPPVGSASDVDFLFYKMNGSLVPFCPEVGLAVGITCQLTGVNNIGGDAVEFAAIIYNGKGPAAFQVSIVVSDGPDPTRVKYVPFDFNGTVAILEHDTQSGTAFGHSNGEHVASVAAAAFYFTEAFDGQLGDDVLYRIPQGTCTTGSAACLEDFSSAGEIPIFFDEFGTRLGSAVTPDNPRFTGVDGSNTSFFAFDSSFDDDDGDGRNSPFSTFVTPELDNVEDETPNFFGTSASAPNVAAVAALMLQKNPALTTQEVYDILSETAQPVSLREDGYDPGLQTITIPDAPGRTDFNYDSGHGLVDAEAAVTAATPDP